MNYEYFRSINRAYFLAIFWKLTLVIPSSWQHQFNYPLHNHIVEIMDVVLLIIIIFFFIFSCFLKKKLKEKYNVQVLFNELFIQRDKIDGLGKPWASTFLSR